jgi:predicted DNA-binding transcriptional regulator AlpA
VQLARVQRARYCIKQQKNVVDPGQSWFGLINRQIMSALSRPVVNAADVPQAGGGLLDPLLNSKTVRRDVGEISEICLWRWTKERGFPRPDLVLGDRKYWHRSSIERWIEGQKAAGVAAAD